MLKVFQRPGSKGFNGSKRKICPEVQATKTKGTKRRKKAKKEERNEERERGEKKGRRRREGSKGTREEGNVNKGWGLIPSKENNRGLTFKLRNVDIWRQNTSRTF